MASLLTSTARVKRRLSIPAAITQHDDAIDDLVGSVDTWLAGQLGCPGFTVASYTDTIDVDRGDVYQVRLSQRPVVAVSSLKDDGDAVTAADYRVHADEGYVSLADDGSFFTPGRGTVVVTYTAGFSSAHAAWADLQRAATDWCAAEFNRGPDLGLKTHKVGNRTVELGDDTPRSVREVVARFARVL